MTSRTDDLAEFRERWLDVQRQHGLSGIVLAGRTVVTTPEQRREMDFAMPPVVDIAKFFGQNRPIGDGPQEYDLTAEDDSGPKFFSFPIVTLGPGEHRQFADGWQAINWDGIIFVREPIE